jgi:hypothetical protein
MSQSRVAVAEAEEGECPALEAVTRGVVKPVIKDTSFCVTVICEK